MLELSAEDRSRAGADSRAGAGDFTGAHALVLPQHSPVASTHQFFALHRLGGHGLPRRGLTHRLPHHASGRWRERAVAAGAGTMIIHTSVLASEIMRHNGHYAA